MDDLGAVSILTILLTISQRLAPLLPLSLSPIFPTPIALGWMIPLGRRNPLAQMTDFQCGGEAGVVAPFTGCDAIGSSPILWLRMIQSGERDIKGCSGWLFLG